MEWREGMGNWFSQKISHPSIKYGLEDIRIQNRPTIFLHSPITAKTYASSSPPPSSSPSSETETASSLPQPYLFEFSSFCQTSTRARTLAKNVGAPVWRCFSVLKLVEFMISWCFASNLYSLLCNCWLLFCTLLRVRHHTTVQLALIYIHTIDNYFWQPE